MTTGLLQRGFRAALLCLTSCICLACSGPSGLGGQPVEPAAAGFDGASNAGLEPLELGDFNATIEQASASGETWPGFATLVALKLVGESIAFTTRKIEIRSTPERFATATITIIDDGTMDDSIRGSKHSLELVKAEDGSWTVTRAWRGWRCRREERQRFAAQPCP